ncbi:hypothetical protein G7046_g9419 [Stylonectria norvegica]|nr:hypothetical protein G7046_g9419 [Stylonectria norvegica]
MNHHIPNAPPGRHSLSPKVSNSFASQPVRGLAFEAWFPGRALTARTQETAVAQVTGARNLLEHMDVSEIEKFVNAKVPLSAQVKDSVVMMDFGVFQPQHLQLAQNFLVELAMARDIKFASLPQPSCSHPSIFPVAALLRHMPNPPTTL